MTNQRPRGVDVHSHCVPWSVLERARNRDAIAHLEVIETPDGPRLRLPGGHTSAPIQPDLLAIDRRIAVMDARGIDLTLLSSFIDIGAHNVESATAATYAELLNGSIGELVASHPQRLAGMATLPMHQPEAAAAELERTATVLGFVGAEIGAANLHDPRLDVVWATATRLSSIILVHPEAASTSSLPYFLGNYVGNPYETTVAGASLLLAGVLDRHPTLTIVLVHGGGFLPYQLGRLRHGLDSYGPAFGVGDPVPDLFGQFHRLYFDTILHNQAALEYLVATVGSHRVLLGTDDPFVMGDSDPIGTVGSAPALSERDRDSIISGNARRLLGLAARSGDAAYREA